MINNYYQTDPKKKINLLFSNKSLDEVIFKEELDKLSNKFSNFKIKYFITRQNISNKEINNRRIELSDILISNKYDYFICGSIAFVRDFWTIIKKSGIDDMNIYTESFF
jgi:ferredoxin-NADP reductase